MTEEILDQPGEGKGMINKLMIDVMGEVSHIAKNKTNQGQKFQFRGIDDVMGEFHDALYKNKIYYTPRYFDVVQVERESKQGATLIYTRLMGEFTFRAPDGSFVTTTTAGEAMDSGDKSTNKAMSAALKYALLQTFCVPVEPGDDADSQSPELKGKTRNGGAGQQPAKQAQQPAPAASVQQPAEKPDQQTEQSAQKIFRRVVTIAGVRVGPEENPWRTPMVLVPKTGGGNITVFPFENSKNGPNIVELLRDDLNIAFTEDMIPKPGGVYNKSPFPVKVEADIDATNMQEDGKGLKIAKFYQLGTAPAQA